MRDPYYNFLTTLIRDSLQDIQSIMLEQLMEGCRTGNVSVVKACLADSNFDPNELTVCERPGWLGRIMRTEFIEACYNGHTELVTLLLQEPRIDINKATREGATGFMSM